MLFNEPKLLKSRDAVTAQPASSSFSALQRAEIAEIPGTHPACRTAPARVSVLFNEPKLLKYPVASGTLVIYVGFSALQRAEIAEIQSRAAR